ncbi:catecholate siderophore receptor CirA [compost metagenome]|jgi:outer membrane receptor for ferrienterochelin and colicins
MAQGTPSYTQVDVGVRYYVSKDVLATAGVYNVLDKQIDYETYDTILDGRRYTVGLTYNF